MKVEEGLRMLADLNAQPVSPIVRNAAHGVLHNATHKKEKQTPSVAEFLLSRNRKYRRAFAKKHGIFLQGSSRPIVNTLEKR